MRIPHAAHSQKPTFCRKGHGVIHAMGTNAGEKTWFDLRVLWTDEAPAVASALPFCPQPSALSR